MCGCKYSLSQGFCGKYISEKGYAKTLRVSMRLLQGFPQYAMICKHRCEISDAESRCRCEGNNRNNDADVRESDKVKENDEVDLG